MKKFLLLILILLPTAVLSYGQEYIQDGEKVAQWRAKINALKTTIDSLSSVISQGSGVWTSDTAGVYLADPDLPVYVGDQGRSQIDPPDFDTASHTITPPGNHSSTDEKLMVYGSNQSDEVYSQSGIFSNSPSSKARFYTIQDMVSAMGVWDPGSVTYFTIWPGMANLLFSDTIGILFYPQHAEPIIDYSLGSKSVPFTRGYFRYLYAEDSLYTNRAEIQSLATGYREVIPTTATEDTLTALDNMVSYIMNSVLAQSFTIRLPAFSSVPVGFECSICVDALQPDFRVDIYSNSGAEEIDYWKQDYQQTDHVRFQYCGADLPSRGCYKFKSTGSWWIITDKNTFTTDCP